MFMARFIGHLHRHAVAYVALFFALSGTALAGASYITKSDTITKGDLAGSIYGDPLIAAGKVTNGKLAHSSLTVNTGTGLSGGGGVSLGGSRTLSVATPFQLPQGCSAGQVVESDGLSTWGCGTGNIKLQWSDNNPTASLTFTPIAKVGPWTIAAACDSPGAGVAFTALGAMGPGNAEYGAIYSTNDVGGSTTVSTAGPALSTSGFTNVVSADAGNTGFVRAIATIILSSGSDVAVLEVNVFADTRSTPSCRVVGAGLPTS